MAYDPSQLRTRREAARHAAARRRRGVAAGVIAVVVVAIAVVVAVSAFGGTSEPSTASAPARDGASAAGTDRSAASAPNTSEVPGARPAPNAAVPILMYHVINRPPAGAPYPDLYVTGDDFAAQMERLKRLGYTAVTQQQVWDAWHEGGTLPPKPIVVSFDDGYQGVYKRALPVLRQLRWPGVVNLEVKVLGQPEQGGLTPAMVRGLVRAGWEINSHTVSHVDMTKVSAETARAELADSRAEIRRRFGVPVNFFCYPAGKYDARVEALVEQAGYLAATTVDPGLARKDEPYRLKRVRIDGSDSLDGFERKLEQAGAA